MQGKIAISGQRPTQPDPQTMTGHLTTAVLYRRTDCVLFSLLECTAGPLPLHAGPLLHHGTINTTMRYNTDTDTLTGKREMRQYSLVIPLPPLRQNHNILNAELLITAAQ